MAFGTGDLGPPAYNIGIDVMQLKVPPRTTFREFVDSVSSQVCPPPSVRVRGSCALAHARRTGRAARRGSRARGNPALLLGVDPQGGVHKGTRNRARVRLSADTVRRGATRYYDRRRASQRMAVSQVRGRAQWGQVRRCGRTLHWRETDESG